MKMDGALRFTNNTVFSKKNGENNNYLTFELGHMMLCHFLYFETFFQFISIHLQKS